MAGRPQIWQSSGACVRSYFKIYSGPGYTEGLFAGEMSRFTILTKTCVVGVAASTPNPRPTRN